MSADHEVYIARQKQRRMMPQKSGGSPLVGGFASRQQYNRELPKKSRGSGSALTFPKPP
jgi:hypothetical protein